MNTNIIRITKDISVNEINYDEDRVLTFKQLVECYDCKEHQIGIGNAANTYPQFF